MAGNERSGRPGGNPDLEIFQFEKKYDWDEPCIAKMTLKLPPSLFSEVKKISGWQEKVRIAIADLVDKEKQKNKESTKTQS